MRIIGICRFSYLTSKSQGFQSKFDSRAKSKAYLYDEARMATRFRYFEQLTLPSIAGQTDKDFTFIILTGRGMPKHWLDRLNDVCRPVEQIRIIKLKPMGHHRAMREAMNAELARGEEGDSLQFRLDDDDAVAIDFVQRIRHIAHLTRELHAGLPNMAIKYLGTYRVMLTPDGILKRGYQKEPFGSAGLAILCRAGDLRTVMHYGHNQILYLTPLLMLNLKAPMALKGIHDHQDSKDLEVSKKKSFKLLTEEQRALLKARFNVDDAAVRAAF